MPDIDWRRIGIIAGFVLLVVVLAYLLFILFFSGQPTTPPTTTTGQPTNGLPNVGPGKPGQITPGTTGLPPGTTPGVTPTPPGVTPPPVTKARETILVNQQTAYATLSGNSTLYYQPTDGHFYQTNSDGTTKLLSDQVFHDVQDVTWSPNRDRAVLEYPDGSNIVYDFQNKKQVTLPKHWQDFSFSPAGQQLAFESIGLQNSSSYLGVANADGSQARTVEPLGDNANKVEVHWSPNQQVIALYHENSAADQEDVYLIGLNGENFRSINAPGVGFQSAWSPDGQRLIYSVASALSSYKPMMWVTDANGDTTDTNRQSLSINTWANKCTFASASNIICAVPQTLANGSGLVPQDIAASTPDDFYEINLDSGQRTLLVHPAAPVTAAQVLVSDSGHTILAQDESSGRIYKFTF